MATAAQLRTVAEYVEREWRFTKLSVHPFSGALTADGCGDKLLVEADGTPTYANAKGTVWPDMGKVRAALGHRPEVGDDARGESDR